jgi:hypothetical protein
MARRRSFFNGVTVHTQEVSHNVRELVLFIYYMCFV